MNEQGDAGVIKDKPENIPEMMTAHKVTGNKLTTPGNMGEILSDQDGTVRITNKQKETCLTSEHLEKKNTKNKK